MHEIDIWSFPRGHQNDVVEEKKKKKKMQQKKWEKIVQADTRQIDQQNDEKKTMTCEGKDEGKIEQWMNADTMSKLRERWS